MTTDGKLTMTVTLKSGVQLVHTVQRVTVQRNVFGELIKLEWTGATPNLQHLELAEVAAVVTERSPA